MRVAGDDGLLVDFVLEITLAALLALLALTLALAAWRLAPMKAGLTARYSLVRVPSDDGLLVDLVLEITLATLLALLALALTLTRRGSVKGRCLVGFGTLTGAGRGLR